MLHVEGRVCAAAGQVSVTTRSVGGVVGGTGVAAAATVGVGAGVGAAKPSEHAGVRRRRRRHRGRADSMVKAFSGCVNADGESPALSGRLSCEHRGELLKSCRKLQTYV